MAGLISAYVELPGASNHEDFKFPWSMNEINDLGPADQKFRWSKRKSNKAVMGQLHDSGGVYTHDYQAPTTAESSSAAPAVESKRSLEASQTDRHNSTPNQPNPAKSSGLKKSLKYMTDLVKQKIVNLEERALSNSIENAKPANQMSSGLAQGSSTDCLPTKSSKRTTRTNQEVSTSASNHQNRRRETLYDPLTTRASEEPPEKNRPRYPTKHVAQGSTTLPPSYRSDPLDGLAEESQRRLRRSEMQELIEEQIVPRKDRKETIKPNQDSTPELSSKRMRQKTKAQERSARKSESSRQVSNTPGSGLKAPDSKAKLPPSTLNDLQIHSDEDLLTTLKRFHTIFLIDDSASMASSGNWEEALKVLRTLSRAVAPYDSDGIEVQFLNSKDRFKKIQSLSSLSEKLKSVQPTGDSTPTETKVEEILRPYLEKIESQKARKQPISKPLNLIIITDGIPDDVDSFISIISFASSKLDAGHFPLNQIGIQFVQVGTERQVSRVLKTLDNNLQGRYGISRDLIDTTRYMGALDKNFVAKCLLGGINRRVDRMHLNA